MNDQRPRRIAHLAEGAFAIRTAKMTVGVLRYGSHESVAVIDSTKAGMTAQQAVGSGGAVPVVATLEEALAFRPDTLLIGITPTGGRVPREWRPVLLKALERGLDLWAGMHDFLSEDAEFAAVAQRCGREIRDLRKPARDLPVGGGLCRWAKSPIMLAVGTDCALGKMTVCLEIDRLLQLEGFDSRFVATGQTGIAIAGWGSPIDAIPGDFMAGAVERDILSVDGCDLVLVEGQGSLLHPGFSSVTLGLLHGACAEALILCHDVERAEVSKIRGVPIPSLSEVADLYLRLAAPIRPARIVGVALKTSGLSDDAARAAVEAASLELGVPATDVVRFGAEPLIPPLRDLIAEHRKRPE